jgi:hypothetical protein
MGARPYDPGTGRFLSVDPVLGGSLNDYDYAGQDPINDYDLNGTMHGGGVDNTPWCGRLRGEAAFSCVMHALCTRHRLVWPGDCSKPDRVARGLAGCVRAVLNPRDLVQGYFRDKFLEWAANGGSRLAAVIEKYSWVGDAASCVAGGIKGG